MKTKGGKKNKKVRTQQMETKTEKWGEQMAETTNGGGGDKKTRKY